MPKPNLFEPDEKLCSEIIATFLEGHKQWRSDLSYPESHSDMKAGVMALLKMFKIERRPLAIPLRIECHGCNGQGKFTELVEMSGNGGFKHTNEKQCPICGGKGYIDG